MTATKINPILIMKFSIIKNAEYEIVVHKTRIAQTFILIGTPFPAR